MDDPTVNAQVELAAAIAAWLKSRDEYNAAMFERDGPHYGLQIEMPILNVGRAFLKAAGLPTGGWSHEQFEAEAAIRQALGMSITIPTLGPQSWYYKSKPKSIRLRRIPPAGPRILFERKERLRLRRRREPIPQELRWAVFNRDDFTCQECGSRHRLEADHVKPYSLGGETTLDNLQTLCHDCNARKGARV